MKILTKKRCFNFCLLAVLAQSLVITGCVQESNGDTTLSESSIKSEQLGDENQDVELEKEFSSDSFSPDANFGFLEFEYKKYEIEARSVDINQEIVKDHMDYYRMTYDDKTIFPENIDFDPQKNMEQNINPGLGVRTLHERGITGKGVNVAIVDSSLNFHKEYEGKIIYYKNLGGEQSIDTGASMHGTAVSSILLGETVGVAPDANVYYASFRFIDKNATIEEEYEGFFEAINHLLDLNESLPNEEKFKILSLSRGGFKKDVPKEYTKIKKRANEQGVWLLTVSELSMYVGDTVISFMGGDREINSDSDNFDNYRPSMTGVDFFNNVSGKNYIIVPMV